MVNRLGDHSPSVGPVTVSPGGHERLGSHHWTFASSDVMMSAISRRERRSKNGSAEAHWAERGLRGEILHHRLLLSVAVVLILVMAPSVISSLGARPVDAALTDHSGGHTASPTCNGRFRPEP